MANYAGYPGSVLVDFRTGKIVGTFGADGLLTSTTIQSNVAADIVARAEKVCKTGYKATITSKFDTTALGSVTLIISGGALPAPVTVTTNASTGVAEFWLAAGTYTVKAKKTGYISVTATFTVAAAAVSKDVVFTGYKATITTKADSVALGSVALTITGGTLTEPITVTTNATTGVAEVWLTAGTYDILAQKPGYEDAEDTVTIVSAAVSKDVALTAVSEGT